MYDKLVLYGQVKETARLSRPKQVVVSATASLAKLTCNTFNWGSIQHFNGSNTVCQTHMATENYHYSYCAWVV